MYLHQNHAIALSAVAPTPSQHSGNELVQNSADTVTEHSLAVSHHFIVDVAPQARLGFG
jgi:hypothetical protein